MPTRSILQSGNSVDYVDWGAQFGQRFIITVDTEEDFDWNQPFSDTEFGLESAALLDRFQLFCKNQSVTPIYLVDYPIITHAPAAERLKSAVDAGEAHVGMQLHPWVNPPQQEELNERNSFAGNLPRELERAKILTLTEEIEKTIGVAPIIYRAGRYGAGPHTAELLTEAGIVFDSSVRSGFDYSAKGGPDYAHHPLRPYWLDRDAPLMELPLTTTFWGLLRRQAQMLYPKLRNAPLARSLLSRTGFLERIALTPEGIGAEEAIRAIDIATDDGLPLLNFSFHSPSLQPGHTPYVRSEAHVDRLYDWWRSVLAYCAQRNVRPASLDDLSEAAKLSL
ncbi:polysaccharide deacetylase family protein [Alterisphingorhabdus coralli]|uniref:Polysaccharide deacetylase family protein n=1 Tax=Alterisphingorhabdus coralli TaxID=3071408 RepID=A0AA97F4A5_9SPHN|nr:polysaccharide deacetylase family protein [Parasphingorhabdus sp. SCSIO 66989]WOE74069.1 polysaccharide deacetylase family protein [Parasphingorhabdus sp. SCSIO 66989]